MDRYTARSDITKILSKHHTINQSIVRFGFLLLSEHFIWQEWGGVGGVI